MDEKKFNSFPITNEEVEAWCSDPNNAATPEQMLEFYNSAYPNLIIRLSDARDEIEKIKAENERLRVEVNNWKVIGEYCKLVFASFAATKGE